MKPTRKKQNNKRPNSRQHREKSLGKRRLQSSEENVDDRHQQSTTFRGNHLPSISFPQRENNHFSTQICRCSRGLDQNTQSPVRFPLRDTTRTVYTKNCCTTWLIPFLHIVTGLMHQKNCRNKICILTCTTEARLFYQPTGKVPTITRGPAMTTARNTTDLQHYLLYSLCIHTVVIYRLCPD